MTTLENQHKIEYNNHMVGIIKTKDVLFHWKTIVNEYGLRFYFKCLKRIVFKKRGEVVTFLSLMMED